VGTASYVESFVDARGRLLAAFSESIEVIHGVPILMSGCNDIATIRGIRDVMHWTTLAFGKTDRDLSCTRLNFVVKNLEVAAQSGSPMAPHSDAGTSMTSAPVKFFTPDPATLLLNSDLTDTGKKEFFECSTKNLPVEIPQISAIDQLLIIDSIIVELNTKFHTELARSSDFIEDEPFDYVEACAGMRLIIVGASHANRLAGILDDLELNVVDLTTPGWSVTEQSVTDLTDHLADVLREHTDLQNVIIYHLFDNSAYHGVEDGSVIPPVKGGDNRYHILGELALVDRQEFKKIFNCSTPLLRAGGEATKVLLSPLLRYSANKCCEDPTHIVNFGDIAYYSGLGEKLADIKHWLKEFTFGKRIRNAKVLNPNKILEGGGARRNQTCPAGWPDTGPRIRST
jgi:hypothetical protein